MTMKENQNEDIKTMDDRELISTFCDIRDELEHEPDAPDELVRRLQALHDEVDRRTSDQWRQNAPGTPGPN
jgi:hypothetical protein